MIIKNAVCDIIWMVTADVPDIYFGRKTVFT